jgi:hypothetical protein
MVRDSVASHRRPARRFQVIGVFILVAGAIVGSYSALSHESRTPADPAAQATVLSPGAVPDQELLWRAYLKKKAEVAAAEQAAQVSKANEVAAKEAAAKQASTPNVPSSCNQYSGNRALGCALLLEAGFGLDQMPCLDKMWTKESNWRIDSYNASSGADGIPQALPASKMAVFGADYMTNPVTQIRWGLDYITKRYGTPCQAWSYWQAHGWY